MLNKAQTRGNRTVEPGSGDDGYRPNVGIILLNRHDKVFWARRANRDGWQFPQGGVKRNESLEQALFRELYEEVGLSHAQVNIVARTERWLHYDLPEMYLQRIRRRGNHKFRGQKQIWFLLRLLTDDSKVCLDNSSQPEFDRWRWTDWRSAVQEIVDFKRNVYKSAFSELRVYLSQTETRY